MRISVSGFCVALSLLASASAFAQDRMTWVAIVLVYQAPADAVDWRGPWTRGMTIGGKDFFPSERACKAETEGRITRMHQGMKAPMLYRCVPFPESLP